MTLKKGRKEIYILRLVLWVIDAAMAELFRCGFEGFA